MKLVRDILGVVAVFWLLVTIVLGPLFYIEGRSKSSWIKKRHGIDVPWYEAACLSVNVSDSNSTVDGHINVELSNAE